MGEKNSNNVKINYEDRIRGLRLMDDEFMSIVFDDRPLETQFILRIILGRDDIFVESSISQKNISNLKGRSGRLDIRARDTSGKLYDIEIQRKDSGASHKRARYYSSLIDTSAITSGEDIEDLPESYVIFITENDTYGDDLPMHHIERTDKETCAPFNDEEHIIYVNGSYIGDDPIGWLMSDFRVHDPDRMHSPLLANVTRYYKENEEEMRNMSSVFEEVRAEGMAEGKAVGMAEGKAAGKAEGKAEAKDLLSKLFIMLEKDNRVSDYSKAVKDSKYMDQLLEEYGLA